MTVVLLFQSTLPRGSDIHSSVLASLLFKNFNPRSLAGATIDARGGTRYTEFQSTLPRGSDSNIVKRDTRQSNFNPRSLAGATALIRDIINTSVFQSTLPRGSDFACNLYTSTSDISIHAPSRERRLCFRFRLVLPWHFNPRSLAGATSKSRK